MAREMTPQDRAAAIVDKVKSELTPIWLGGRQRMLLEREIAEAIIATRRAALLEAAQVAEKCKNQSALGRVRDAYSYVEANLRKLAQEG